MNVALSNRPPARSSRVIIQYNRPASPQFMPLREDLYPASEYVEPEQQLHRHVLYHTRKGDVVVVDARADMNSGVFGAMMMTYFRGKGGLGAVIDGCIRGLRQAVYAK